MTTEPLGLRNAPIIEAVVDIQCDLPPDLEYGQLQHQAEEALKELFPKSRRQMAQSVEVGPGGELRAGTPRERAVGLQFLTDDERQLIQFRAEGLSFNRLAPYGSLDEYLPIIAASWDVFRNLAHPIQIRSVALRFINRILLPAGEASKSLETYLRCGPRLPDVRGLRFRGFLNQHAAIEIATGNHVNIVMAMDTPEGELLPVILDIETSDQRVRTPDDWSGIRETILTLRSLKNDVFQRTLTPACLNLFR